MPYNATDLQIEIRELHQRIQEKRKEFDEGMKKDMEFEIFRKLFSEIREAEKRLELCFEETKAQHGS